MRVILTADRVRRHPRGRKRSYTRAVRPLRPVTALVCAAISSAQGCSEPIAVPEEAGVCDAVQSMFAALNDSDPAQALDALDRVRQASARTSNLKLADRAADLATVTRDPATVDAEDVNAELAGVAKMCADIDRPIVFS
jgi:hypothetical protein